MTRLALLVLFVFLGACSNDSILDKADAAPIVPVPLPVAKPRNFVCERLALENPKVPCEPELTDEGELHMHRARITIDGQTVVCGLPSNAISVGCGPMFVPAPAQPEVKKQTKQPPKTGGAKK
jgi:hypothetical protein